MPGLTMNKTELRPQRLPLSDDNYGKLGIIGDWRITGAPSKVKEREREREREREGGIRKQKQLKLTLIEAYTVELLL